MNRNVVTTIILVLMLVFVSTMSTTLFLTKAQNVLMEERFDYEDGFDVRNLPTRPQPYSLIYNGADQWYIQSNQLFCENRPVGYFSFIELGNREWVNYRVSLDFKLVDIDPNNPTNYEMILHFRHPTDSYGDRLDVQLVGPIGGNRLKICAEKGGAWYDYHIGKSIRRYNVWNGSYHNVAVECEELHYKVYLDGTMIVEFDEPVVGGITHESGSVGLANKGCLMAFDNLVVEELGNLIMGDLQVTAYLGSQEVQADVQISGITGTYSTPFTIQNMTVGEYTLTATYEGQEQIIPIMIEDCKETSVVVRFAEVSIG